MYKQFKPVGKLFIGNREYWLTSKNPTKNDDWGYRETWLVIPDRAMINNGVVYYDYAREIVATNPLIEYCNCPIIMIKVIDDNEILDMRDENNSNNLIQKQEK